MNVKIAFAALFSATLMVACGTTPSAPSSGAVRTQSVDVDGGSGGDDGGAPTGTLLGNPYPQGTLLATFPRGGNAFQSFTMDWLAVGFSYDWYDRPGVELKVCSFDSSGTLLGCASQNASTRDGSSNRFNTSLTCAPAQNAASFAVYGSDATLHPAGRAIYATSVRVGLLPLLPGPFPPTSSLPGC